MRAFFQKLKSLKLAIGLIAYLAVSGSLATLIPQGREAEFYFAQYPKILAELIVQTGFSRFFTSLAFFLPVFAFFANLSACTVDRLIRELGKKGKRRHGPDVLHLGLMLLVIGAVLSFSGRQEGSVSLFPGDAVELPEGRLVRLIDFEYLRYEDGRPRDWISRVKVERNGAVETESYPIRVNHPLKVGDLTLYQVTFSSQASLLVGAGAKDEHRLNQREEWEAEGQKLFFMALEEGSGKAVVRLTDTAGGARVVKATDGEAVGPFTIKSTEPLYSTGLQAVIDPGYLLVLIPLIISGLGVCLTFFQKLGDFHE